MTRPTSTALGVVFLTAFTVLSVGSGLAGAAGTVRFRPGLWELSTSTPGSKVPPVVNKRCFTAADVGIANGTTEEANEFAKHSANMKDFEKRGCKMQSLRITGDQVFQSFECPTLSMNDVTTYKPGDVSDSKLVITFKKGNRTETSLTHARRLGDCPKK